VNFQHALFDATLPSKFSLSVCLSVCHLCVPCRNSSRCEHTVFMYGGTMIIQVFVAKIHGRGFNIYFISPQGQPTPQTRASEWDTFLSKVRISTNTLS